MIKGVVKKDKQFGLSPWAREHFVPVAVGIIIVLFSLIFVRGMIFKTIKIFSENKKFKSQLSALTAKANSLAGADIKRLNSQVNIVERIFPSKKPSLSLLATLSSLSRDQNVLFLGIELSPGKIEKPKEDEEIKRAKSAETGKLRDFIVDFSIEGKLSDVSQFVTRLEKTAPVMKIESFGLRLGRSKESGLPTGEVKVGLGVSVFYQEPPETIGPVEQKLPSLIPEEEDLLATLAEFEAEAGFLPGVPVGQENLFEPGQ